MIKKVSNKVLTEFHKRFAGGEQYLEIDARGEIQEEPKVFYWQAREVYNKISSYICALKVKYPKLDEKLIYGKEGLVALLIPYQRQYNNIKNSTVEFINRNILYPTVAVEAGSVDIDELEEEGLAPGKVLVYRQGSPAPKCLSEDYLCYPNAKDLIAVETHIVEEMNEIYEFFVKNCIK